MPLLHDAEATSLQLGGVVSPRWLRRHAAAGVIPCTRLGRFVAWSDADIAQLISENYCDPADYGRKRCSRS